ncbi:hypothetical protein [Staphylococcus epidermidis]
MENINNYKNKLENSLSNMENGKFDVYSVKFFKQKEELMKLLQLLEEKEKNTYEPLNYPINNWKSIIKVDTIIINYINKQNEEIQKEKKIIN